MMFDLILDMNGFWQPRDAHTESEGAFAFAGVVVLTMLAATSFDPRLIWDAAAKYKQRSSRRSLDLEGI